MPLVLDLVRHGAAEASHPDGDPARTLTAAGRRQVENLAATFAARGWRPDRVFSSPLARARETAGLLAGGAAVEILAELTAAAHPGDFLRALAAHGAASGHVVAVGHQPLLGDIGAYLTGAAGGLRPGEMWRIRLDGASGPGAGRLLLTLAPEDPS